MSGKYLLDTNIIIGLFNGDQNIVSKLEKLKGIFIPNIAIGELYYGSYNSRKSKSNIDKLEKFIQSASILSTNVATSKLYGSIKNKLRKAGKPIPENDIWIAAIAEQHGLTVITTDNHFKLIESIRVKILEK